MACWPAESIPSQRTGSNITQRVHEARLQPRDGDAQDTLFYHHIHTHLHAGKLPSACGILHQFVVVTRSKPSTHHKAPLRVTLKRRLKWRLSLRSQSGDVTPLAILPVKHSRVASHAVVPDNNSTRLPADSGLKVLRESDVVIQEFQQVVRLLLLESDNVAGDCRTR